MGASVMDDENQGPHAVSDNDNGPVLVALDFTADSQAALLWACRYAARVGVEVIGLHVVHDPGEAPGYYKRADSDLLRPLEDVAVEMMDEFIAKVLVEYPDLPAIQQMKKLLVKGIPATRILELAEKYGVSMIVMGSRGRTGLPHLLLGSKAERVVQLSPLPVTIVKANKVFD